ncbi:Ribosome recycling factor [Prevotella sp. ne3005]|jgi:hypothetical protein|uniref:ribosome recycling factor n=1 Tax=Prevotella sp. ne3005 TaxID=1761887 RepID=UPI0008D3CFBE|nr:ribosome recycling factor [Prevotella sp. ne3005]MBQ3745324.1 ribosome recycling factor [Prevotella sp.]SEM77487.1 Ribosome recycling factor [Prevotella sp. ne3005]
MKRALSNQYDQLHEKLTGYVAMLNFRFLNMCIKAEPASLIPVKVNIEGSQKNLEQVAMTAKKDDYRFWILPKYDEDMKAICEGIAKVHPEFKQKELTLQVEGIDGEGTSRDVRYLQLTMPDVNDKYYKALKDAIDVFYQQCKTLMEAAANQAKTEIAILAAGEPKEDVDGIKKEIDKLIKKSEERRDQLRDKKQKEVEEAYKVWLEKAEL